ncbi:MAG: metalloregulator ArsR/SmtB family transcription factor [Steroidobacteraceae bacterium]|nr:metalloregulator ArsR/SmtB family transcription factor [Steroidobacteraceae bacterium]
MARSSKKTRPMPSPEQMARHADEAAALLKALAHPARLLVLCQLVEGESSVGELQPITGLSMSALSQHLAVLREMELVTTRRESQTIYYSLAEGPAMGVLDALYAAYCAAQD